MSQEGVPPQPSGDEVPVPAPAATMVVNEVTDASSATAPPPPPAPPVEQAGEGFEAEDEEPPRKRQRLEEGEAGNGEAAPVEASPAAPAVDADDALLGALGDDEEDAQPAPAVPSPKKVTIVVPEVVEVDPLADTTWEDLFGTIPRHDIFPGQPVSGIQEDDTAALVPEDPEQHDSRQALLDCFGTNFASEADVSLYQAADALREAVAAARIEQSNDDVDACFGLSCRQNLLSRPGVKLAPCSIRTVRRPKNPLRGAGLAAKSEEKSEARLLMEMPILLPNRQILHADPEKYTPLHAKLKESTPRAIFTPQNTLQWNYLASKQTYLSNARYVKWSDGSVTLHVGGDVYETFANVDAALHMVASTQDDMDVEAIPVDRHMMVRTAAGCANSIESFIQHHNNLERSIELQSRVDAPIDALPDFDVEKDKRPPRDVTMSLEEKFVKNRRAINAKELAKKHGGRPTLTDYFRAEIETLKELEEARSSHRIAQVVETQNMKIAATKVRFGRAPTSTLDREPVMTEHVEGQMDDYEGEDMNNQEAVDGEPAAVGEGEPAAAGEGEEEGGEKEADPMAGFEGEDMNTLSK